MKELICKGRFALAVFAVSVVPSLAFAQDPEPEPPPGPVVSDVLGVDAGVTAYGTALGATGAAILLLGFGFLLAWKGWAMVRRFVK